ncbi:Asp23/Gls24 family envelope stress response protein [Streptomyces sp. NPDC048639]|uniref:Asp23/Gls24 family envelope stress response protein n=1 Tax=Streptomyces sp. NPDC048639 TaxID=3365581 RepID=UPI003720BEDC
MSAQLSTAAPSGDPPRETGVAASELPPPAERGATVIPERVVARIAARAARESLLRHPVPALVRRDLAEPRSSVVVHHGAARLGLTVDLPYPVDIADASLRMQNHVAERVAELTDLRVTEVTLVVQRLVSAESLAGKRVA